VTDAEAFPGFFTAVTGHEPFEWQDTLTRLLLEGGLPAVIDVPTGFGKTSVVLSWAFALAHADPEVRPPRRLLMVVDRRLVVDASYDLALRLRSALTERATALVAGVADGLQALTDPAATPLAVARIRGGMTWESVWLPRADQAAVVAATVDQVGSRLLFRGYGASARMRPVDAALVGTDAWLVLDEAHIAEPLLRTARSVAAYQALPPEAVVRPLRVTAMTATPPDAVANSFKADPAVQRGSRRFVQSAAAAAARLDARKPVRLVEVTDLVTPSRKLRQQIEQLGQVLGDLALGIDAPLVGVMANTVVAARAAHARVTAAGVEAVLLIGRCREHERDVLWREYATRLLVGRARDEERLVVVATQTLEVGADVDLDALVTECAPLSSLLQRFGRVDRVGTGTGRVSAVVHAPALHAEDPVYGSATAATWQHLCASTDAAHQVTRGSAATTVLTGPTVDLGLESAGQLRASAPDAVRPVDALIPVLTGAHLERWAATSPAPVPDAPIDAFLHGADRAVPQVRVTWRVAPPLTAPFAATTDQWRQWLSLARPVDWEQVEVPLWDARALLGAQEVAVTSDLETAAGSAEQELPPAGAETL